MKGTMKKTETQRQYPEELTALIERGRRGDRSVAKRLRELLREYPELISGFGDLAKHAENTLVIMASGEDVLSREAIQLHVHALRERLLSESTNELEKVLAERVVLCWVNVNLCEVQQVTALSGDNTIVTIREAGRRLDQANNRFLSSARSLATVRKLLRRVPGPFDFVVRRVHEMPASGTRTEPIGIRTPAPVPQLN